MLTTDAAMSSSNFQSSFNCCLRHCLPHVQGPPQSRRKAYSRREGRSFVLRPPLADNPAMSPPFFFIYNMQMDADRLPEVTQKPFLGPGSLSLQSAGIERTRMCLQGEHFVRCCHSTHSLLFGGFSRGCWGGGGVSSSLRPKSSASICSV